MQRWLCLNILVDFNQNVKLWITLELWNGHGEIKTKIQWQYMFFFSQFPELPKAVPLKNACTCKYCVAWTSGFSCYIAIRGNYTAVIHELSLCFAKDWLGHRFIQCLFHIGLYHLVVFRGYKKVSEWQGDWYQCPFKQFDLKT